MAEVDPELTLALAGAADRFRTIQICPKDVARRFELNLENVWFGVPSGSTRRRGFIALLGGATMTCRPLRLIAAMQEKSRGSA
jgi:hypothetical protein